MGRDELPVVRTRGTFADPGEARNSRGNSSDRGA
jgi:hypothetical protein